MTSDGGLGSLSYESQETSSLLAQFKHVPYKKKTKFDNIKDQVKHVHRICL